MKKRQIVIDSKYMPELYDFDSVEEILIYCAQLYTSGYNKIECQFDDTMVCKTREETDEEFNKRIEIEKNERAKRKLSIKKEKEKEKEKRLKLYEKLKKEFEK